MDGTVFVVALFSFLSVAYSAKYQCAGVAKYSLAFYGNWSAMRHPNAWPSGAQFSPLVGASHSDAYTMWEPNMMASEGVKNVAERGDSTALESEINERIMSNKTAWKLIKSGDAPTGSTAHVMKIAVEVTKDFPLVSLVSMLFPSPDWFIGIMKVSLCDTSTGKWMDSLPIDMLQPWDAGTDDGQSFRASNSASMPQGNITMITKSAPPSNFSQINSSSIPSLGKLMFQRQEKPTMATCSGEVTYTLKFESKWSQAMHPNGFPPDAHFSPLVIATHTYRYKMWSDMTRASPGVKKVAEEGVTGTLNTEVKNMMKTNFVYKSYQTPKVKTPDKDASMKIMVKDKYSMVSFVSMIAPSPDWFVGVDSYDLCGSDGKWINTGMMDLRPWDAGTDSGPNFMSANMPTMPYDVIKRITSSSNTQMGADANKAFAKVTFTKEMTPTPKPTTASASNLSAGVLTFMTITLLTIIGSLH